MKAKSSSPWSGRPFTCHWPAVLLFIGLFLCPALGQTNLIVRLYYGDRAKLNQLVSQYDIFEFADHQAGYVDARLSQAEFDELTQSGYRVEVDAELTVQANTPLRRADGQASGIPSFLCYRTVEETYTALAQIAANHPNLATLLDIGDSWEKVTPGAPKVSTCSCWFSPTNPGPVPNRASSSSPNTTPANTPRPKPPCASPRNSSSATAPMLTSPGCSIITRSMSSRWPIPTDASGPSRASFWRKNTDNNDGCTTFPNYGTDLNRNSSFKWGLTGSSGSPCAETYRGPSAFSEPENVAVRDYILSLFPDQRGPNDTDAAPATATGLVINLHSYSPLIIYPWGWTSSITPNSTAFRTLGGRFSHFNRYTVQQAVDLYAVSGELTDWIYGELGVAAYTFEMGTAFFQPCTSFENTIYPSNRPALYYAAKACRQPYLDPAGPDVHQPVATPATNALGGTLSLQAGATSGRTFGYSPLPAPANITAARYSVDNPSWVAGVVTHPLTPLDGTFNSTNENVMATVDTTGWSPGRHTVFLEACTGSTNWGVPTAVFVTVEPLTLTAVRQSDSVSLRWPSAANRLYTLLQSSNPTAPFTILATNLPAQPPTNSYSDLLAFPGERFYRVLLQPGAAEKLLPLDSPRRPRS